MLKKGKKTITFKIIAAIILLLGAWWLTYGGGRMLRYKVLNKYFGITPPGQNYVIGAMTDEQNVELMRKALPPDEFAIWKANWDYEHGDDEWKGRTAEEIQKMKAEFYKWRDEHHRLFEKDYKAFRKKYAPLFGEKRDEERLEENADN